MNLGLFSDLILKGMLNLIVTIVRMHCCNQLIEQPEEINRDAIV